MSLVDNVRALIGSARAGPEATRDAAVEIGSRSGLRARRVGRAVVLARAEHVRACVVFSGHVDVVPPGEGWNAFDAHVASGRVVGRGACDMLGPVACFLELAARRPDLPIAIALTTDEETMMSDAESLLASRALDGALGVVVGEPTDFEVGVAEKGVMWARLVALGRAAHASMPEKGENAITKLLAACAALERVPAQSPHARLGRATMSLDMLRAGTQVNVVPERAEAEIDFRFLPPRSAKEQLALVTETARAFGVAVAPISMHEPFEAHAASRILAAAKRTGAAGEVGLPYGTEASKFSPAFDCIILGPGERALAHTRGESIAVADLERGVDLYERLADERLKLA
ncbi:MAG: M20/M25/M40 family metallo-hydrolase [Thermoplasmatota archaeon]